MKILFLTTDKSKNNPPDFAQGDYLENSILIGLKSILGGENVIDLPRKDIIYGDFSIIPRESLHGKGFSLYSFPLEDKLNDFDREHLENHYDVLIYGTSYAYGMKDRPDLEAICDKVFWLDGHDLLGISPKGGYIDTGEGRMIGIQQTPCFKRELIQETPGAFPTGFGLPSKSLVPVDLTSKKQLFQQTAPKEALFQDGSGELGQRKHHIFTNESDYHKDLESSWFGLTCRKGGWDTLRHYEIIAKGALLLFRDYDKKPVLCSPQSLPTISYSTKEELYVTMNRLVVDGKPTKEYTDLMDKQRGWFLTFGSCEARANFIVETIKNYEPKN